MEPTPQPAPNLAEAKTFFVQLLQQLRHTRQLLPEGLERKQLDEVIGSLEQPLHDVVPAAEQARAEMASLRQRSQEQLQQATAALPAQRPASAIGAGLGARLRGEVVGRYGKKPEIAPEAKPLPADDDRMTDDLGSVASKWQDTEGSAPPEPTPPKPPTSPTRAKPTQRPVKGGHGADAWDDLSKAEE